MGITRPGRPSRLAEPRDELAPEAPVVRPGQELRAAPVRRAVGREGGQSLNPGKTNLLRNELNNYNTV